MASRRFDRSQTDRSQSSTRTSGRAPSRSATSSGKSGAARSITGSSAGLPIPGSGVKTATGSSAHTSDVRRNTAPRSDNPKGASRQRSYGKSGMGLRAKFMVVLAGVTAAALILLGISMAATTNSFLFGQKQHGGVEIARMAAQIGTAVHARLQTYKKFKTDPLFRGVDIPSPTQKEIEREIVTYLNQARDWYANGDYSNSDILAIRFDCPSVPEISQVGVGDLEESTSKGKVYTSIYVPKAGRAVSLPQGITVMEGIKSTANGEIPIYRFKIALDSSFGQASTGNGPANVRVDIAADSVNRVRNNLFITIGIAVLIAIGVVVVVANWLAGNITKPLDTLISDMKVVARGRLDHETKPHSNDEIGMLANEFNRMTQNLKIAQSALVEQEKAEYELSIAREVQRQLLPAEAPTIMGYDAAAFYQGAKAVSGDYFDFIPLGNGMWGFIIADVSGKGIPGSMVMAVTRTIIRLIANKYQTRAADTLKETNRLIAKQIKRGMFVTAFYAILDENSGHVTYASAGHNPMVVVRANGQYELANSKGIALGFNEGPIFDKTIEQNTMMLHPGDSMVLYTDGFPEAMNAANEEFGEDKFYGVVAAGAQLDVRSNIAHIVQAIAQHRGAAEQSDDLTMIAIRNVASA
jgi:serine phosphatase RsbU (regulator of sigma subunit)